MGISPTAAMALAVTVHVELCEEGDFGIWDREVVLWWGNVACVKISPEASVSY